MLYFNPITDIEQIKAQFKDKSFDTDTEYCMYQSVENGECTGTVLVGVQNGKCFIYDIALKSDDPLLCEGLIRSALNFAANRGAYMAYCGLEEQKEVLEYLGFEKTTDTYSGEIPELLKGSCCK